MENNSKPLPLTVAREQFRKALEGLVNTSGLPAFVMYDTITDLKNVLEQLMNQQYQRDLEEYRKTEKEGE